MCCGISHYFKQLVFNNLKQVCHIAPCFDEFYNEIIKEGQIDVLVQFWDIELNKANTGFVNELLGKAW